MGPSDGGVLLILFASILGGAIGARLFGGSAWKGAVTAIAAMIPSVILVAASSQKPATIYVILLQLVSFNIAALVIRLSYNGAKGAFVGNLLFSLIAFAIVFSIEQKAS